MRPPAMNRYEYDARLGGWATKLDSVVRVSANRLRTRLEEHYRIDTDAEICIVLHKGSYIPPCSRCVRQRHCRSLCLKLRKLLPGQHPSCLASLAATPVAAEMPQASLATPARDTGLAA